MIFTIVELHLTLSCQLFLSTVLKLFFALHTQLCLSQLKGIRLWNGTQMEKQSCRTILFSEALCWGLLQWLDVCSTQCQCINTNEPQVPGTVPWCCCCHFILCTRTSTTPDIHYKSSSPNQVY